MGKISGAVKKIFRHKIIAGLVMLGILAGAYYGYGFFKGEKTEVRYALASVTKGTLITTVSGTGQVSASDQVDVKPKTSGQIVSINVKNGQAVKEGDVIAVLDSSEAQKSVRNANIELQNAKLSMEKLMQPADGYEISAAESALKQAQIDLKKLIDPPTEAEVLAAKNAVAQAKRNLGEAKDNSNKISLDSGQTLQKAYDDGYTAVSNAYLEIPDLVKDDYKVQWDEGNSIMEDNLYSYKKILGEDSSFIEATLNDYDAAKKLFDESFDNYKDLQGTDDPDKIVSLIDETLASAKAVSRALESARNMLDAIINQDYENYFIAETVDELRPMLQTDIGTINNLISAIQSAKDTIDDTNQNIPYEISSAKAAIASAQEQLEEKETALDDLMKGATAEDKALARDNVTQKKQALDKLEAGADKLDVQVQELAIRQKQNALADAEETLADYTVRAPFDCVVAEVSVAKGDTVSSGTAIATVISKKMLAEVSLNEIDVAKVQTGQKATLTFDAVEDLSISGDVVEIDTLGTVSQGVGSYNIKVAFDTQDPRIKPGMSVSAEIINEAKTDVLTVPVAAVKTQGDISYVEMIDGVTAADQATGEKIVTSTTAPRRQQVETGLSNDTSTEIVNGLSEGDLVVSRTVSNGKSTTATSSGSSRSGMMLPGLGGGRPPD
jgi:HlyD family secretion protein